MEPFQNDKNKIKLSDETCSPKLIKNASIKTN